MLQNVKEIQFKVNGDARGKLVVAEGKKDIPFNIARVFYIYGADKKSVRGCHANRKSEFVFINICGSSRVKITDGHDEAIYLLDKPYKGIYIPKMIWKEMYDFSRDAVLLVLSSEPYDAMEYIREYKEYIKEANANE